MDPSDAFSASLFRWDPRAAAAAAAPPASAQPCPSSISMALQTHHQPHDGPPPVTPTAAEAARAAARELEEVFEGYGVRYATVARIGDLGFTASTLVGMREEEVDDMMATLSHLFRWDLLVGERYGIKAAIRAERRRIEGLLFPPVAAGSHHHGHHHAGHLLASGAVAGHHHLMSDDPRRRLLLLSPEQHNALDALSQEGLSEEPVQLDRETAGSGGETAVRRDGKGKNPQRRNAWKKKEATSMKNKKKKKNKGIEEDDDEEEEVEVWGRSVVGDENGDMNEGEESESERSGAGERQREHPFIVTEPGEVARAKKNGLDYLFHLYEQCHEFLLQVQAVAKERGDKCPTKVTNLVFRYAKKVGASYINKPKMRHYVHCYALHVLDEEASNALRRAFKERGENVGAWRLACYKPLVGISAAHAFDIDVVFNAHPRLSIWYVPTKLRQLCHLARSSSQPNAAGAAVAGGSGGTAQRTLGGSESGLRPSRF